MFDTFYGFFAAYIPLVALAIIGICKENKLIVFLSKSSRGKSRGGRMNDKYEAQLKEVEYNRKLVKQQISKAKKGKLFLTPGNGIVEASPGGLLNILEDQLRDLEIQKGHIMRRIKEENQDVVL